MAIANKAKDSWRFYAQGARPTIDNRPRGGRPGSKGMIAATRHTHAPVFLYWLIYPRGRFGASTHAAGRRAAKLKGAVYG
jgi:hypothetical protein